MNIIDKKILIYCHTNKINSQREISKALGISLGSVNKSVKNLFNNGLINDDFSVTKLFIDLITDRRVNNAIILAAGAPKSGSIYPDSLYIINEEIIIERLVKQLREKNINEIYIIIGFRKEMFLYLEEKHNVNLIINREYSKTGTSKSLLLALDSLSSTYIIPGDLYFKFNPFREYELFSWYGKETADDFSPHFSSYRLNKSDYYNNLSKFIGITYLNKPFSDELIRLFSNNYKPSKVDTTTHWESLIFNNSLESQLYIKTFIPNDYKEVSKILNKDVQDKHSNIVPSISEVTSILKETLELNTVLIKDINRLKNGMTNHSFKFQYENKGYVVRIPKEPSNMIINRKTEFNSYESIKSLHYIEKNIYLSSTSGIKVSLYFENSRIINPNDINDVTQYTRALKIFHNEKINVDHEFDIIQKISEFELLVNITSTFIDYIDHRNRVFLLAKNNLSHKYSKVFCHIDSNFENYLIDNDKLYFIDFEYSGMADPLLDLAMFSIYAGYDKQMVDLLVELYLNEKPSKSILISVYIYISLAGILWSNWCGYYNKYGYEFNEYWLNQYKLSKRYYFLAQKELSSSGG